MKKHMGLGLLFSCLCGGAFSLSSQAQVTTPYTQYVKQQTMPYSQGPTTQYIQQQTTQYTPGTTTRYVQGPATHYVEQQTTQYTPGTTTRYTQQQTTGYLQGSTTQLVQGQQVWPYNQVMLGPDGTTTVAPMMIIGDGDTSIQVFNPGTQPVTFSSPALGISYEIPANSERTIQIPEAMTANLTPGQEVAYYILDPGGNTIASNNLVENQEIVTLINTNTAISQAYEVKPAPSYKRRSTVRGYW